MKLGIPIYKQSKINSCGPTALRMVLAYYGIEKNEMELVKIAKTIKKGTRLLDLGIIATKLGFDVNAYSFMLKKSTKKLNNSKRRLIELGANYKFKQPSMEDVIEFLKLKIPVILSVNSAILFKNNKTEAGHFIVVTGYDDEKFYYNDPWDGKRKVISKKELLFSWYNNVIKSSGYLLAIKPNV